MSNFPTNYDDDSTILPVSNNITEIGEEVINQLRDAVFNIETNIGLTAGKDGYGTIADRLNVIMNSDGTLKPSVLVGISAITDANVAVGAAIDENKLDLAYSTQSLHDLFIALQPEISKVELALAWQSFTGSKLDPHISGLNYKHTLDKLSVMADPLQYFKNNHSTILVPQYRSAVSAYTTLNDLNEEFLYHQFADGYAINTAYSITTNGGSVYPSNYAHTAAGVYLDSHTFSFVPQTVQNLQQLAEFVDIVSNSSLVKNLYSNGISKVSSSPYQLFNGDTFIDGYGTPVIPITQVQSYLLKNGSETKPYDNISDGDDIIEFLPSSADKANKSFDAKFNQVNIGDILRINYGLGFETSFIVKEKKYLSATQKYIIRIDGKNLAEADGYARIDRPLENSNKYGVLALSAVNSGSSSIMPSLVVGNPRNAQTLGIGFNPNYIDKDHYMLYLELYPTGNPQDNPKILPAIDISGNQGKTPGNYTLDSVVEATNAAFRAKGFNYRFSAFQYNGEFGIMLSDPYNNASFSIISAEVDSSGLYVSATYPKNIIGVLSTTTLSVDALGFGPYGANVASPPYSATFGSVEAAKQPTKVFVPRRRNNYYVNGLQKEHLNTDIYQLIDKYGDGYWLATVETIDTTDPSRIKITYRVPTYVLSTSKLAIGKTIVVQPLLNIQNVNYGRFIIEDMSFTLCGSSCTYITVYDAVHAYGSSGGTIPNLVEVGDAVAIYFNADSVSFNAQNASDCSDAYNPAKRYFEVYEDGNNSVFTYERARFFSSATQTINDGVILYCTTSDLAKFNIVGVSPKLKGYVYSSTNKITLNIASYNSTTNVFSGYLCNYNGSTTTNVGKTVYGKPGEVVRFYDETNIDYIEVLVDINETLSLAANVKLDIQLFPTLALDTEIMLIGSCQLVNSTVKIVNYLRDIRQFGNISEKDFTTSAIDYLSSSDRLLRQNGVINGFEYSTPSYSTISFTGGTVLVNGKLLSINNQTINLPAVKEQYPLNSSTYYNLSWIVCINENGQYENVLYSTVSSNTSSLLQLKDVSNTSSTAYLVNKNTFDEIIVRKDITPLYRIATTIDNSGVFSSTVIYDIRKYINDVDSNLQLRVSDLDNGGNFKTLLSAMNWAKLSGSNAIYLNKVQESYANNTDLTFSYFMTIDGENTSTLTFDSDLTLGSNITFKNINIILNSSLTISGSTNIIFDNCNITFANALGHLFDLTSFSTFKFINSTVNCTYASTVGPADDFSVFKISDASNITIQNATINCVYNTSGLLSTDLVSTGKGSIYGLIQNNISNVLIDNVIFNYNTVSADGYRYSFINFELSATDAYAKNINITNCQFNSVGSQDDIRPAIAIINTVSDTHDENYPQPTLFNVNIKNNIGNKNQSIILTSKTKLISGSYWMKYPGLVMKNCMIEDNICGVIGYWCANNINNTTIKNSEKGSALTIRNNSCHLIASVDHKGFIYRTLIPGDFITATVPALCDYPSGYVDIINNKCNWISTANCYKKYAYLRIMNNNLNAYSSEFYNQFTANSDTSLNDGAIVVFSEITSDSEGNECDANTLISGNIVDFGYEKISNSLITYYYDYSYIYCAGSNIIENNILKGINLYGNLIVIYNSSNTNISNNKVYRDNKNIYYYILNTAYISPSFDLINSIGIITNNYFDSPYINDSTANYNTVNSNGSTKWIYDKNINQTVSAYLYPYNGKHSIQSTDFGSLEDFWNKPSSLDVVSTSSKNFRITYNNSDGYTYHIYYNLSNIIPINSRLIYVETTAKASFDTYSPLLCEMLTAIGADGSTTYNDGYNILVSDIDIHRIFDENILSNYYNLLNNNLYIKSSISGIKNAFGTLAMTIYPVLIKYRW